MTELKWDILGMYGYAPDSMIAETQRLVDASCPVPDIRAGSVLGRLGLLHKNKLTRAQKAQLRVWWKGASRELKLRFL